MPKPAEARAAPLVEHRRYRPQPEGHQHGYHQLLFGLAGASELELDGHLYRVDDRTGLIVPAGSHHDYMGYHGNLQLVADFPAQSVALPARLMARPRAFALDGAFGNRVRALAAGRTAFAARAPQADWHLAATLAATLADSLGMPADREVFPLMSVDACLRANLAAPLRVPELAAHFGWSVRRFQTLFAEAFGDTPHRYQTRLRLDRALQWLSNARLSLAEIALMSGYPDQTTFTRSFTRRFGLPPGAWRAATRG
ncbi:helix-turn-helix transcriptional regulator [Cupriavidus neocaledonicus]|uniref:AraC-type DNA-binding protein n=1 Tax=Cupriavidus neocaledonicus TaxID=1040979 RepID=A0A375HR15_9BURK|nr:AraC family transcriptional regulator [Cupriavidus neocaledonicus]SOZ39092.1 putative transcriptional regulator, HTH AraC type [Cupriavidus neocaledonicus]SPD59237.1 AraC-type DNA-binding protein [Cupriavidus neocaledonicus]